MGKNTGNLATEDTIKIEIRSEGERQNAKEVLETVRLPITMNLVPPKASDELTSRMHCAIRAVSQQAKLGGERLTEEEWKLIFVAQAFGQRVVPNPGGKPQWIVIQKQTRNMSGQQKFDLLDLVYAFGAERGVEFDE